MKRVRARSTLRKANRAVARELVTYNGPEPRYEPARDDSCHLHHRQAPCKRCAGDHS